MLKPLSLEMQSWSEFSWGGQVARTAETQLAVFTTLAGLQCK